MENVCFILYILFPNWYVQFSCLAFIKMYAFYMVLISILILIKWTFFMRGKYQNRIEYLLIKLSTVWTCEWHLFCFKQSWSLFVTWKHFTFLGNSLKSIVWSKKIYHTKVSRFKNWVLLRWHSHLLSCKLLYFIEYKFVAGATLKNCWFLIRNWEGKNDQKFCNGSSNPSAITIRTPVNVTIHLENAKTTVKRPISGKCS